MNRSGSIAFIQFVLLLVAVATFASGCGPIRSGLNIEAGEEFVLGGEQTGRYSVEVTNAGTTAVAVERVDPTGSRSRLGTAGPGDEATYRFGPGDAAVFVNLGTTTAIVKAVIRGDTNLGMRYEPTEASGYLPQRLSPEEATEDVRLLRRVIEEIHPGYGRYTSAAAMNGYFDHLERMASEGVSDMDLYREVSHLLAAIRCDHTKAELPKSIDAYRRSTSSYLPFTFRLYDGRMFVDRTDPEQDGLARGDEVLVINGRPVGRVLDEVASLVSVDGWTDDTKRIEMEYSSEYLGDAVDHFWPFLYGWPESWTIKVRDRESGDARSIVFQPLTYGDWLRVATDGGKRYVDFPESVEFRMLDDETAYLSIGTFVNYRNPVAPDSVFDPIFDEMRAQGAKRLILDLRSCGGGSDDVPAALTTYLSDTIVPSAKRPAWVRTRNIGEYREYLSTWDESVFEIPAEMFTDVGDGYFELRQPVGETRPAPARDNRFTGRVMALSSAANASGSTMFLAMLQEHYGVTIVGEPTGGSAEGPTAGILFYLDLPNSGIRVRVPALRSWVNIDHPIPGRGVMPDLKVRSSVESWLLNEDPVLDAALSVVAIDR